jgi:4-carboxymuconolactone decarboxylase
MPRLPELDPDTLSPEARRVHDAIAQGPRGKVEGPLRVWLTSPELADKAQALGAFCRFGSSLPPHLSELAIITVGAHWKSGFEWAIHAPIALAAGVDPAVVEAIRVGGEPAFDDEEQRVTHAFARVLLETHRVPQPLYDDFVARMGTRAAVDLVGVLGYYTLISMTINAFEVAEPEGVASPFG